MANDFYQIYRADVMRLAKTMVIKSEISALATNRALQGYGVTSSEDKRTWRYYMNIAGLYHSTNTMMRVRSLDTLEMIDFTVENMQIHRATAREYAFGSRYYESLVSENSRQETLILGILNPIDIDAAIAAKEGEILWMDKTLVDSNEDNLQELIQQQISAYLDRWHVEMYSYTEDLYDPARLIILYVNLPLFIMTARMKNSRTFRSHSFHLRQFLASNGRLDRFFDAMNKKQQLFLYRNLPYLHRYPGHQDSFNWLVEEIMEERNFPLADYRLIQNVDAMPEETVSQVELIRRETTKAYSGVPETKVSVQTVLEKQVKLARRNKFTLVENETETTELMQLAKVSQVQTKVLESSVLDMTDSQVYKLEDFLLNHWMYLSSEDRYRAITNITNPRTGEPIQLTALDAFILFIYVYNRAVDQDLTVVPDMVATNVLKIPAPTPTAMYALASASHVTMQLANALWDLVPPLGSYISTESFYNAISAVHQGAINQHALASFQGNYNARAQAEAMALFMFMDKPINLADRTPYGEWLYSRGLETVVTFSKVELNELWKNLLFAATGMDLNITLSLNDIHRSMVGIMERMSSYSVHFIREINDRPLKPLANKFIRIGDSLGYQSATKNVDVLTIKEIKSKGTSRAIRDMTALDDYNIVKRSLTTMGSSLMPMGLSFKEKTGKEGFSQLEMPYIQMIIPDPRPDIDLSLYNSTSDIVIGPIGPREVDLRQVIVITALSGLNLPDGLGENIPLSVAIPNIVMDGFDG